MTAQTKKRTLDEALLDANMKAGELKLLSPMQIAFRLRTTLRNALQIFDSYHFNSEVDLDSGANETNQLETRIGANFTSLLRKMLKTRQSTAICGDQFLLTEILVNFALRGEKTILIQSKQIDIQTLKQALNSQQLKLINILQLKTSNQLQEVLKTVVEKQKEWSAKLVVFSNVSELLKGDLASQIGELKQNSAVVMFSDLCDFQPGEFQHHLFRKQMGTVLFAPLVEAQGNPQNKGEFEQAEHTEQKSENVVIPQKILARGDVFQIRQEMKMIFMEWKLDQVSDNKLVAFVENGKKYLYIAKSEVVGCCCVEE